MFDVPIPDHLFKEATQAAARLHQSLEEYVAEAVRQHLLDDLDSFD